MPTTWENNKYLMTSSEGNSYLETLRFEGNNVNCFLRDQSLSNLLFGEQGWCSGESTRLPPMWTGFKSRHRHHMWVEFVVDSLPCSERFFSRYSSFPLSSKTNISKFQFDHESGRWRTTMWMCYLQIVIYYFIYLFDYTVARNFEAGNWPLQKIP